MNIYLKSLEFADQALERRRPPAVPVRPGGERRPGRLLPWDIVGPGGARPGQAQVGHTCKYRDTRNTIPAIFLVASLL